MRGVGSLAVTGITCKLCAEMSGKLRISTDGPEFPGDFVDSLLAGEVIFLCGTGMSAPQMPDFQRLVEHTYETLAVEKTDSEKCALGQERYEEVLGSLSRRLSDPDAVTRTVSHLLAVGNDPNLDQHRTILRLSRDPDNRISVVTTNFDTLLERAARKFIPDQNPHDISFAGQALPAPGRASFSGIIHIHGRLVDSDLGLEATPLVLTSADYGDAYMRSGWVSRFLFDLARCKTIVLVGYSANDAPVRYFLSVLEADRARFPDLKRVYAFSAYHSDPKEATNSWGTLAVTPLPYCRINSETGTHDHSPLWGDLTALANIIDHPDQSRQERARSILERPASEANADARGELGWLFGSRHRLWPVALEAITDPDWFTVLQDEKLWSPKEAAWVIAAWVAKDFEHRAHIECALDWQRDLGKPFTREIAKRLRYASNMSDTWALAWRMFCNVETIQGQGNVYYEMKRLLSSQVVLDRDLRIAVSLIAPSLMLSRSYREFGDNSSDQSVRRLDDIVGTRLRVADRHGAQELVDTLCAITERAGRILDLATAELQSAVELETEINLIVDEYDHNDYSVPSIENHPQNRHHHSLSYLTRVLVGVLPHAASEDRDRTRGVAIGWTSLPGRIGLRLCLHATRDERLFSSDEAMENLLCVSDADFWLIAREVGMLLRDRSRTACPALVHQVEERIRNSANQYYERYPIAHGEVDWRKHARDTKVWLRLNMLQAAGTLSETGVAELQTIKQRRYYLDRPVEDRDFFGSYSTGVRVVTGDVGPITEASEDARLRVARELVHSPEPDRRLGWSAFCRSDPQAAFDLLSKEELTPANGGLWNQFLVDLALGEDIGEPIRDDLTTEVFKRLASVNSDVLQPMTFGVTAILVRAHRQRVADVEDWLARLWEIVSVRPRETLDLSSDIYEKAINSEAGMVAQKLLIEIDVKRQEGVAPTAAQVQLLEMISENEGTSGQLGRAILAANQAVLIGTIPQRLIEHLEGRLKALDAEGMALRAVMLRYGSITPELTRVFREAVLRGAVESKASDIDAADIVSKIIEPALADVRGDGGERWGLTPSDVAHVLREASKDIRGGALEVLADCISNDSTRTDDAWRVIYGPFFEIIWPREHVFRDACLTHEFIALAVSAGDEFPEALDQLRPYIVPFVRGYGNLHSIVRSELPEKFPRETLSLLRLLCGRNTQDDFHEMGVIIDRIVKADRDLEVDRRLQGLESQSVRFG